MKSTPCEEHCWHAFTTQVLREGKNVHGAFCPSNTDSYDKRHQADHLHPIIVHKKKCCHRGNVKTTYDEYVDSGEKVKKQ